MGLIKYLGKPEVLDVRGSRSEKIIDGFGVYFLYPNGTERIVKKYLWLPKKIGGLIVRGNQIVKQVSRIVSSNDSFDVVYNNRWSDVQAISTSTRG